MLRMENQMNTRHDVKSQRFNAGNLTSITSTHKENHAADTSIHLSDDEIADACGDTIFQVASNMHKIELQRMQFLDNKASSLLGWAAVIAGLMTTQQVPLATLSAFSYLLMLVSVVSMSITVVLCLQTLLPKPVKHIEIDEVVGRIVGNIRNFGVVTPEACNVHIQRKLYRTTIEVINSIHEECIRKARLIKYAQVFFGIAAVSSMIGQAVLHFPGHTAQRSLHSTAISGGQGG